MRNKTLTLITLLLLLLTTHSPLWSQNRKVRIYFKFNSSVVDSGYRCNDIAIKRLAYLVSKIKTNPVDKISIKSYSAFDGVENYNSNLSMQRSRAIRGLLRWKFPETGTLTFELTYKDENWDRFKHIAKTDMNIPEQDDLLRIVLSRNKKDVKEKKIREMNNGKTFDYVEKNILKELRYAVIDFHFTYPLPDDGFDEKDEYPYKKKPGGEFVNIKADSCTPDHLSEAIAERKSLNEYSKDITKKSAIHDKRLITEMNAREKRKVKTNGSTKDKTEKDASGTSCTETANNSVNETKGKKGAGGINSITNRAGGTGDSNVTKGVNGEKKAKNEKETNAANSTKGANKAIATNTSKKSKAEKAAKKANPSKDSAKLSADNNNNVTSPADHKKIFAVKTNLLFDIATAVNVELEVPVEHRLSIFAEYTFPWWRFNDKYCLQMTVVGLGCKYWFDTSADTARLQGWFAGCFAGYGRYDLEWKSEGRQGHIITGGIMAGYAHNIARNLSVEYSLGIAYAGTEYEKYYPMDMNDGKYHYIRTKDSSKVLPIPAQVKVSLVWTPKYF